MVIAEWFTVRFGQVLAPDENFEQAPPQEEAFSILDIVAPDPKFTPKYPSPDDRASSSSQNMVLCAKCKSEMPTFATPTKAGSDSKPSTGLIDLVKDINEDAKEGILQAVLDTKKMLRQSDKYKKTLRQLQSNLEHSGKTTKATRDRFTDVLESFVPTEVDQFSLREGRTYAYETNHKSDQGLTLLHLASKFGHKEIVEILLTKDQESQLKARTAIGDTALHLASYHGQDEVVEILNEYYKKYLGGAPPDVVDFTPYAVALLSPCVKAVNKKKRIDELIGSPDDPAVLLSHSKPLRTDKWADLGVVLASSDIAGKRIVSEDACSARVWEEHGESIGLVCVSDGHDDQGMISKFITDNLHLVLEKHKAEDWEGRFVKAFQEIDDEIKTKYPGNGGATVISAVVTPKQIIVGNVGDSRCILIQKGSSKNDDLTEAMSNLSLDKSNHFTVTALSNDHKVSGKELERLQKAGASLKELTYEDQNGEKVTTHKLHSTEGGKDAMLSMSRSMGDFEFKKTPDGLICTPEVLVRDRDSKHGVGYLVLACDGVFDVQSNEEVARIVMEGVSGKEPVTQATLEEVANRICRECIKSGDNVTVAILALGDLPQTAAEQSGVPPRALDNEFAAPEPESQN